MQILDKRVRKEYAEELVRRVNQLKSGLHAKRTDLAKKVGEKQKEIDAKEKEAGEKRDEIAKNQNTIADLKRKKTELLPAKIQEEQEKIAALRAALTEPGQSQLRGTGAGASGADTSREQKEAEIRQAEEEIQSLRKEIVAATKEIGRLENRNKDLDGDLSVLQTALRKLKRDKSILDEKKNIVERLCNSLEPLAGESSLMQRMVAHTAQHMVGSAAQKLGLESLAKVVDRAGKTNFEQRAVKIKEDTAEVRLTEDFLKKKEAPRGPLPADDAQTHVGLMLSIALPYLPGFAGLRDLVHLSAAISRSLRSLLLESEPERPQAVALDEETFVAQHPKDPVEATTLFPGSAAQVGVGNFGGLQELRDLLGHMVSMVVCPVPEKCTQRRIFRSVVQGPRVVSCSA